MATARHKDSFGLCANMLAGIEPWQQLLANQ
jgi:hypothetical protein